MKISVIIPTHNRSDALAETLKRFAAQGFAESWELIVVNNNSTDDTDAVVARLQKDFPVSLKLVHEKKPGPAAARNAGARAARGEYLLFIDNDILTEPDFLARHYKRLLENPGCWIVNQLANLPEQRATVFGEFREQFYPMLPRDAELSEAEGIAGQGASMPRRDFENLGGYDEKFFVASGEDRELAMRAQAAGIKILLDPSIVTVQNDWAGASIRDYCQRQRIYKQTEPFFWQKHGERYHNLQMVRENLPPDLKTDGVKLFAWKQVKRLLSTDAGQKAIIGLCETTEKVLPTPPVLWRFYRLALAGAIYRGFNEGLAVQKRHNQLKMNDSTDIVSS